jgi:hypothetical protein
MNTRGSSLPLVATLLLGTAPLAACGGDHDRLEGTWVLQDFPTVKGQKPCTEELDLDSGQIVSTLSCLLKEGTYGQQVTIGEYRRQETTLFVKAKESSCPEQPTAEATWVVAVDHDNLERTAGNVTTSYHRGKVTVDGIKITGCFDASLDNFDEGAIFTLR